MLEPRGVGLRVQGIPGQEDEPLAGLRIAALQRPIEARPVQFRHAQITQDQIIRALLELHERQPAVGRSVHGVAVALQQMRQRLGDAGFIIHNQNDARARGQLSRLGRGTPEASPGWPPTGSSTRNVVPCPT